LIRGGLAVLGKTDLMSAAKLPMSAKIGFGLGDYGFNLVWSGTGLFLMYVYTDVFGVSPTIAGAVYALALVWDAVTDPVMGVIADRTRTKWGRYRPWIALGALPLGASYALAYWNPGFTGVALIAWIAFTHCFLRTAYTVASIPFSSLQARLSNDANERTTLAGFRMIGAASGGLTVALLTPLFVHSIAPGDEARGYLLAAIAAGILCVLILGYVVMVMREPAETGPAPTPEPMWRDVGAFFEQLVKNGPLAQVFLVIMTVSIAVTMFGKNVLYYFKYVLEAPQLATFALIATPVMMLFLVPVWALLAQKTSKRIAWMIGATISVIGFAAFYFNPSKDPAIVFAIIAVIAVGGSSFGVLFWSMLPDTVEWGEAKLGVRHEAKVFGFASFAQKAALGINALLLGLMLDGVGYVANTEQTPQAIQGIVAMMALIPLAGVIVSMLILWTYPIDAKRHAELRAEIAARAAFVSKSPAS
jgi:glycoside/pentoside/hexuronide:cation symporter, GPH family